MDILDNYTHSELPDWRIRRWKFFDDAGDGGNGGGFFSQLLVLERFFPQKVISRRWRKDKVVPAGWRTVQGTSFERRPPSEAVLECEIDALFSAAHLHERHEKLFGQVQ